MLDADQNDPIVGPIVQMKKMLSNVESWLMKAAAYANARSFEPRVLLTARLAPDQMPFVRQVQGACDRVKFAAARLTGKQAPQHPDTEQTIDELCLRIQTTIRYLDTFEAGDFCDATLRTVEIPFFDGKTMRGGDYFRELVVPGFYFHVSTAYAILRHNGVALSMRDFIGSTGVLGKS